MFFFSNLTLPRFCSSSSKSSITIPCEFAKVHLCVVRHRPRISAWLYGVHLKNIWAKFVFSTHNSSFCFCICICICIEKVALILIAWDDKIMIIILNCLVCWLFDLFSVVFLFSPSLNLEWTSSASGTKMEATSKWTTHLFILWQRKAKSNTNTTRRWQ